MSVILRGGSAETHASAAPGSVDYVLDEVKATPYVAATSGEVAVFDGAASATLRGMSTLVGAGTSAGAGFGDTALGFAAQCSGSVGSGVAIGWQSRAGDSGIAIGGDARALQLNSITIGPASSGLGATAEAAIAIGRLCGAAGVSAVSVGDGADADGVDSVSIGRDAVANGGTSVALGALSTTLTATTNAVSIAIGDASKGGRANEAIAVGSLAVASLEAGVALGANTSAGGIRGVALGGSAAASGGANAGGTDSIAIGAGAKAPNSYDIAIGFGADSTGGSSSIAIGRDADATAQNTVAIGHTAVASAAGAIAIGQNATASAADAITVGASYLAGNMVTAKHLSPAAAAGVALGTSALYYSSLYVDAAFPRSRAADFARVNAVQSSGAAGTYFTTTGGSIVTFPNVGGGAAFTTSIIQPAGSAFTNASTASIIAISYNGTAGYTNLRVTCHLPTLGADAGQVQALIGTGATLGALATYGAALADVNTAGAGTYSAAAISEVVAVSGVTVVGVLWRKVPGGTARAGNASGTQLGTLIVEQL